MSVDWTAYLDQRDRRLDPRTPTGREVFAEEWADYLDHRDQRANDLDGAESDARALGFASRADRDAYLRDRALRTLAAVILEADPDGQSFGTSADVEAGGWDLTDEDIADEPEQLTPARVDELLAQGIRAYLTLDHEAGRHDPAQAEDHHENARPNPVCPSCYDDGPCTGAGPGVLPLDRQAAISDAVVWFALRVHADQYRRALARAEYGAPGALYSMLAPAAHPINPADVAQAQYEDSTVWGSALAGADMARAIATACEPCRAGRHVSCEAEAGDCTNVCHPVRYGYRGQYAAR